MTIYLEKGELLTKKETFISDAKNLAKRTVDFLLHITMPETRKEILNFEYNEDSTTI